MLTLRTIGAIQPGSTVWDDGKGAVPGFGARRQKGAAISYVLKYRTADGRQRWQTIGRHGAPWTPDTARAEARRILAEVAKGSDPAGVKQGRGKPQRSPTSVANISPRQSPASYSRAERQRKRLALCPLIGAVSNDTSIRCLVA